MFRLISRQTRTTGTSPKQRSRRLLLESLESRAMMTADNPMSVCLPLDTSVHAGASSFFSISRSGEGENSASSASLANSPANIKYEGAFGSNAINGWVLPQQLFSINDSAPIQIGKQYALDSQVSSHYANFASQRLEGWQERDLIRVRANEDLLLTVKITSIGTINPTDAAVEGMLSRLGRIPEPGIILGVHSGQLISAKPSELQNTAPLSNSNPSTRIGYNRQTGPDGRVVRLNESSTTIRIPRGFSTITIDKFGPWLSNYRVEFVATRLTQRSVIPLEVGRFLATHGINDGRATFRTDSARNVELRILQSPDNPSVPGPTWVITHGNLQNASATNTTPEIDRLIEAVKQRVGSQARIVALNWGDEAAIQLPAEQASVWLKPIGKQLGHALHQLGVQSSQANYIGFSYGAHINYFAANELMQLSRGAKAESMWALDPASFYPESSIPGIAISDSRFYRQGDINLQNVAIRSYAIHTDTGEAKGVKAVQDKPGDKNPVTAAFGSRKISSTADHRIELRLADDSILAPIFPVIGNRLRMHEAPLQFFISANSLKAPGAVTSQFRIGRTAPTIPGGDMRLTARIDFNYSGAIPKVIPLALQHEGSRSRVSEAGEVLFDSKTDIAAFKGSLQNSQLQKQNVFNAVRAAANTSTSPGPVRGYLGLNLDRNLEPKDELDLHVLSVKGGQRQIRVTQDSPSQVDVPLVDQIDLVLYSSNGSVVHNKRYSGSQFQTGINVDVPKEGGFIVVRLQNSKVDTSSHIADLRYEIIVR